MPKIVDHEARRQLLVEAACRVIARDGIDNVTVRQIAAESGFSSGTLAHYFKDKDDILRSALERADDNIRRRIDAMPDDLDPRVALRRILCEALPLDAERTFELTLDVNFWARALNQPALRKLQHSDHDEWRARVGGAVAAVCAADRFDPSIDGDDITDILVAFVDGLGLQALVYPELITSERIELLLDLQLQHLTGGRP